MLGGGEATALCPDGKREAFSGGSGEGLVGEKGEGVQARVGEGEGAIAVLLHRREAHLAVCMWGAC